MDGRNGLSALTFPTPQLAMSFITDIQATLERIRQMGMVSYTECTSALRPMLESYRQVGDELARARNLEAKRHNSVAQERSSMNAGDLEKKQDSKRQALQRSYVKAIKRACADWAELQEDITGQLGIDAVMAITILSVPVDRAVADRWEGFWAMMPEMTAVPPRPKRLSLALHQLLMDFDTLDVMHPDDVFLGLREAKHPARDALVAQYLYLSERSLEYQHRNETQTQVGVPRGFAKRPAALATELLKTIFKVVEVPGHSGRRTGQDGQERLAELPRVHEVAGVAVSLRHPHRQPGPSDRIGERPR